jgi:hypothetical protein
VAVEALEVAVGFRSGARGVAAWGLGGVFSVVVAVGSGAGSGGAGGVDAAAPIATTIGAALAAAPAGAPCAGGSGEGGLAAGVAKRAGDREEIVTLPSAIAAPAKATVATAGSTHLRRAGGGVGAPHETSVRAPLASGGWWAWSASTVGAVVAVEVTRLREDALDPPRTRAIRAASPAADAPPKGTSAAASSATSA